MSVDQRTALTSRRIHFTSKGGGYAAMFTPNSGKLYQQYEGSASAPTACYPDYSVSGNNVTCYLTVTSARKVGAVEPTDIEYYVAGTKLTFNAAGTCTTTGFTNLFKVVSGNLVIIGNLVSLAAGASFNIQAKAILGTGTNPDYVIADLPYECAPYVEGQGSMVSIVPGDTYNFVIGVDNNTSVILAAKVFNKVWLTATLFDYTWEQFKNGAWATVGTNSDKLTVSDAMVDTYSLFRVTVKEKGTSTVVGQYTQQVLDASDPYDIITEIYRNESGATGSAESSTTDESLDEDMPDTAYLFYVPKMVRRGSTTPLSGVTYDAASLLDAQGVAVATIQSSQNLAGNKTGFKLTVSTLRNAAGTGEYDLIIKGSF